MTSFSSHPPVERAQPWLGTLVSIRVSGVPSVRAHRAIDAAFAEVAAIHCLMSFHDPNSDVSRLNRCALLRPIAVDRKTRLVLRWALRFSELSRGCFDPCVASELVKWHYLPQPARTKKNLCGSWRDIEIRPDRRVRFHRALWIDLGGIAKGYAVDRAVEVLRSNAIRDCVVNAGGDIRVSGRRAETVALGAPHKGALNPAVELTEASIAGSHTGELNLTGRDDLARHVHGVQRTALTRGRFACVIASSCLVADALTKVVLAEPHAAAAVLARFRATAHYHDSKIDWLHLGSKNWINAA
jgi:FAD:protein FMN transferase